MTVAELRTRVEHACARAIPTGGLGRLPPLIRADAFLLKGILDDYDRLRAENARLKAALHDADDLAAHRAPLLGELTHLRAHVAALVQAGRHACIASGYKGDSEVGRALHILRALLNSPDLAALDAARGEPG